MTVDRDAKARAERKEIVDECVDEAYTGFLDLVREAIHENVDDEDGVVHASDVEWDASEKVSDEIDDYFVAPNERIADDVADAFVAKIHETTIIEDVAEDVDIVERVVDDRVRAGGKA
jgi:uncharacterized protein (DUF885 family)